MKLRTVSLIAVIALTSAMISQAGDTIPPSEYMDFDSYAAMSRANLENAMEALEIAHIALQNQIIAILRSNAPNQEKVAAIHVAGIYRLERVASDLVNIIKLQDERYEGDQAHQLSTWSHYPAVGALAMIGNPAVPLLLNKLATSEDIETRRLSAIVLLDIMDSGPAKVTVQDEIQRRADAKNYAAIARLRAALPLFDPPH
jgi:hypothetical protein